MLFSTYYAQNYAGIIGQGLLLIFPSWHLWQGTMEIGLGVTLGLPQLASLAGDRGNWLGSRPENIIAKSAYCSIPSFPFCFIH